MESVSADLWDRVVALLGIRPRKDGVSNDGAGSSTDPPACDLELGRTNTSPDDQETDKAVSGTFGLGLVSILLTLPMALLLLLHQDAAQKLLGTLSSERLLIHTICLASNCLAMAFSLTLLVYTIRNPAPGRITTKIKKTIANAGTFWLAVGLATYIFTAFPAPYSPVTVAVVLVIGASATAVVVCVCLLWETRIQQNNRIGIV